MDIPEKQYRTSSIWIEPWPFRTGRLGIQQWKEWHFRCGKTMHWSIKTGNGDTSLWDSDQLIAQKLKGRKGSGARLQKVLDDKGVQTSAKGEVLKVPEQGTCVFRAGLQEESSRWFIHCGLASSGKWLWEDLLGDCSNCYADEGPNRAVAVGMEVTENQEWGNSDCQPVGTKTEKNQRWC